MGRYTHWIRDQIASHRPERSPNKQSVVVLADACATLSGKGSLIFGMNMPGGLEDVDALHAEACDALAAWFPHLVPDEAKQLTARIRKQGLAVPVPGGEPLEAVEPLEDVCERLHVEREQSLRRFGDVRDGVLTRLRPATIGGRMVPWPTMMLGTQRLVRTSDTVLLVTDGLSNPWDPSLHDDVPDWTFGFELALEVPLSAFPDPSDEAIVASWAPIVLWAATDWAVDERVDVMARLEHHTCMTHSIPPVAGLEHLVGSYGFIGGLLGIPFGGSVIGAGVQHGPAINGRRTSLLPLKLLTADEYDWAMGVKDSSRTVALAEHFIERGEGHLSWPDRPSSRK